MCVCVRARACVCMCVHMWSCIVIYIVQVMDNGHIASVTIFSLQLNQQ